MSNPVFDEAFATELAVLATEPRMVPTPVPGAPLGYGTDLSCVTDVTADFAEVDPTSVRAIGEAIIRRLISKRGSVLDDPNYGTNVREWLNHPFGPDTLQTYRDAVVTETLKDDRVASATCAIALDLLTKRMRIGLRIEPANPTLRVFTLTFAVTDSAVLIESIV